jgi:hypothetical protein
MKEDNKNQKKTVSKKKVPSKKSELKNDSVIPPDYQIDEVIKQAFLRFHDSVSVRHHEAKDLEYLTSIISEYLNAYMVIGYDLSGEKIVIMNAKTSHDKDALIENLRTTLLSIIGNQ